MRNPLGLPGELVGVLGHLPVISGRLDDVVKSLRKLVDIDDSVRAVRSDTSVLPEIDRRVTSIEQAMPAVLEVSQHLALLPEAISNLDANVGRLGEQIERLLSSLERLDDDVATLSSSVEPLGRLADRMPGGNRG